VGIERPLKALTRADAADERAKQYDPRGGVTMMPIWEHDFSVGACNSSTIRTIPFLNSRETSSPVSTGPLVPSLDSHAVPQLLNYLNVTKLPLGLVLYFGPKPKVKRVIRDSTRDYPITEG
jgi:hypothetical protein